MTSRITRDFMVLALALGFSILLSSCDQTGNSPEKFGFIILAQDASHAYRHPVWSPDSQRIAYTRYEDSDHPRAEKLNTGEIFVMDVLTRQTRQLTYNDAEDYNPTWSHDGLRVAYIRKETIFDPQSQSLVFTNSLRIVNSDGSGDVEIFVCSAGCEVPSWSPDGDRIAFSMSLTWLTPEPGDKELPSEIYTVNVDGTGLTQITQSSESAFRPRWSPDGRSIVFERSGRIWIFDFQSKSERALDLKDIKEARDPTWSSDQSHIVFAAYPLNRGVSQLYLFDLADGSISPLFEMTLEEGERPPDMKEPDWSPDGSKIGFSVYLSQLYLVDLSTLLS